MMKELKFPTTREQLVLQALNDSKLLAIKQILAEIQRCDLPLRYAMTYGAVMQLLRNLQEKGLVTKHPFEVPLRPISFKYSVTLRGQSISQLVTKEGSYI